MTADGGEQKGGFGSQMCQFNMPTRARGLLLQVWYFERAVRKSSQWKVSWVI